MSSSEQQTSEAVASGAIGVQAGAIRPRPFICGACVFLTTVIVIFFFHLIHNAGDGHIRMIWVIFDGPIILSGLIFAGTLLIVVSLPPVTRAGKVARIIALVFAWLLLTSTALASIIASNATESGPRLKWFEEYLPHIVSCSYASLLALLVIGCAAMERIGRLLRRGFISIGAVVLFSLAIAFEFVMMAMELAGFAKREWPLQWNIQRKLAFPLANFDDGGGYHALILGLVATFFVTTAVLVRKIPRSSPKVFGPDDEILHELPCAQCAYNLRTRRGIELCPECGAPVALALKHRPGWAFLRHRVLAIGATWLCASFVLLELLREISVHDLFGWSEFLGWWTPIVCSEAIALVGIILLALVSRRGIRVASIVIITLAAMKAACIALWYWPKMHSSAITVLDIWNVIELAMIIVAWFVVQPALRAFKANWLRIFVHIYAIVFACDRVLYLVSVAEFLAQVPFNDHHTYYSCLVMTLGRVLLLMHVAFWATIAVMFWNPEPPARELPILARAPRP